MEPEIQVDCALLQLLASRSAEGEVAWHTAQRFLRARLVRSLRLRRSGEELLTQLAAAGISAADFKGADFAEHLYPRANLRPMNDIDLLVPRNRLHNTAAVLRQLGYVLVAVPPMRFAASEYGEETWQHQSVVDIEVDLHWNLINHPSLRRRASVELADLDWEPVGPQAQGRVPPTPATRLVIAATHAAFSHQFDRLLLLCDIREAARQLTAATDLSDLQRMAQRTGTCAALDVALGTTAHWLADTSAAELRRRLVSRTIARGGWRLISQKMLLHSGGQGHRVRRRLLRELLKHAA